MRYLNPLRYIHYHTQLAIPTIYDDSLSFYEIMNKTNLHFNEVINDMNENYEIIDKAFQEVLEQTNKWMEEAKAQADRAEQEANKSQASAEDAKNQADRASSEADAAAASALEAQNQADRASSEADRAHTEAENAKAQAQAAANSAQESATSAAASAGSASESAASATESKKSADASAASATESKNSANASANSASQSAASATASQNSAVASANSASQSAASATASQNSAVASANSASQAAQSATDAANSAKEAADTLDEAKETFVKKAGDTMSGKLTISYGGLSVDGSADISGDLNTGRLQVGKPDDHRDTHLYGNLYLNDMLNMSIGSNVALKFANLQDGLKLYAPLSFEPSPLRISNVGNPQNDFDAVNKQTLDSEVRSINTSLTQVNEKITSLTSRMDTAEKNITKNTSDIASLTNRVTTNETSINNINTEITNIKQDITTVEGDYVKKAGDTMTGNLTMGLNQIVMDTGHIAAGNNTLLFEGYPEIDVDGAKISMVADPVDVMDAANKEYVDNAVAGVKPTGDYLPLTGGTMSGDLTMGLNQIVMDTGHIAAGNNTLLFEGYPEIDVDGAKISMVADPVDVMDATNKKYVDNAVANVKPTGDYLPLTGGTMSGDINMGVNNSVRFGAANYALYQNEGTGHLVLTGNSNTDIVEMNNIGTLQFGNKTTIQNVKTPTNNGDAAPKSYVDGQIAVAKNDVQEQMQGYLPLTGGRLSGNLLMGTGTQIDFEEGVHLAYDTDFGFGVQTNGGSVGIVSNNIVHTDSPTALNSKLITYSISDVSVVPGTTVKQYNCDGTGFQQMRFSGFQNVKFASSLLVDEDPSEAMQVATKQYVDQHAGGGGESYYDSEHNILFVINPVSTDSDMYECKCYLFSSGNYTIEFPTNMSAGEVTILHNLNSYLMSNNYVMHSANSYFITTGVTNAGYSFSVYCTLFDNKIRAKATLSYKTDSATSVSVRIEAGFLCSALVSKMR